MYNPTLPKFLRSSRDVVDFVEVIPDMFWTDNGESHQPRFAELESQIAHAWAWFSKRAPPE